MDSPKARASLSESIQNLQPENQAAWAEACKDLIGKAKTDTSDLLAALDEPTVKHIVRDRDPPHVKKASGAKNHCPRNRAEFDAQASVTKAAAHVVDSAIQQVSKAVHKLRLERQNKWAGLKVCEWRIELRRRRPPQELFTDHLQDALDNEVKALEGSRTILAEKIAHGKLILDDCEENKARLIRNVRYMVTYRTPKVPDHIEEEPAEEKSTQAEEPLEFRKITSAEAIPPGWRLATHRELRDHLGEDYEWIEIPGFDRYAEKMRACLGRDAQDDDVVKTTIDGEIPFSQFQELSPEERRKRFPVKLQVKDEATEKSTQETRAASTKTQAPMVTHTTTVPSLAKFLNIEGLKTVTSAADGPQGDTTVCLDKIFLESRLIFSNLAPTESTIQESLAEHVGLPSSAVTVTSEDPGRLPARRLADTVLIGEIDASADPQCTDMVQSAKQIQAKLQDHEALQSIIAQKDGRTVTLSSISSTVQIKARPVVPVSNDGLLKRAPVLQQVVLNFCQKSDAEIQKQKHVCTRANEKVLACFQKRWTENEAMKKNLEQQIAEMDSAIGSAKKSLERMKKRIDHYQETDIQPKYDNAAKILMKLKNSKCELEDDFHRKLVSLKIDECCRKITPERCTGQNPEDMPVAAILEITQKKSMKKTASSPTFTSNDGTLRPGSPLGQSSPLKSAARVSISSSAK